MISYSDERGGSLTNILNSEEGAVPSVGVGTCGRAHLLYRCNLWKTIDT